MISLLRAGGHDAVPAYYRPDDPSAFVPIGVPAPALITRPIIAVRQEEGTIWLDPAADFVEPPATPWALRGSLAWIPGDVPRAVGLSGPRPRVSIQASLTIDGERGARFTGTVTGQHGAEQALRERLTPLSELDRQRFFEDLLRVDRARRARRQPLGQGRTRGRGGLAHPPNLPTRRR